MRNVMRGHCGVVSQSLRKIIRVQGRGHCGSDRIVLYREMEKISDCMKDNEIRVFPLLEKGIKMWKSRKPGRLYNVCLEFETRV